MEWCINKTMARQHILLATVENSVNNTWQTVHMTNSLGNRWMKSMRELCPCRCQTCVVPREVLFWRCSQHTSSALVMWKTGCSKLMGRSEWFFASVYCFCFSPFSHRSSAFLEHRSQSHCVHKVKVTLFTRPRSLVSQGQGPHMNNDAAPSLSLSLARHFLDQKRLFFIAADMCPEQSAQKFDPSFHPSVDQFEWPLLSQCLDIPIIMSSVFHISSRDRLFLHISDQQSCFDTNARIFNGNLHLSCSFTNPTPASRWVSPASCNASSLLFSLQVRPPTGREGGCGK